MNDVFLTVMIVSAIILIAIWMGAFLNNRYSRKWRYVVWIVLSIRLLFPWDISLSTAFIQVPAISYHQTEPDMKYLGKVDKSVNGDYVQPDSPGDYLTSEYKVTYVSDADIKNQNIGEWIQNLLLVLWVLGIMLFLLFVVIRYQLQKKKLLRWSRPLVNVDLSRIENNVANKIGLKKVSPMYQCHLVRSPLMMGVISPKMLIPQEEYSEQELELIFYHELMHIKRKDIPVKALMILVHAIYWFHPLIYLMRREMDKDMEFLCDEAVVKCISGESRGLYNEIILKSTVGNRQLRPILTSNISGSMKYLKERFGANMKLGIRKKGYQIVALFLVAVIGCGFFVSCDKKETEPVATDSRVAGKLWVEKN